MPRLSTTAIALVALALSTPPASAGIVARYAATGPYSDWDFRSQSERDYAFRELGRYLEKTGERLLPPGRSATVEILEIKPAGQLPVWRPGISQPRILSDVTPPRITLRYVVTERGRAVTRGEEKVTDLNYLWDPAARMSSDSLAFEKALLRDWIAKRLVRLAPPPA